MKTTEDIPHWIKGLTDEHRETLEKIDKSKNYKLSCDAKTEPRSYNEYVERFK